MKTIIKLVVASALALSLAACNSAPTKTLSEADIAIKAATIANKKAKKLYVEWRDTGKILKQAKTAKSKKNYGSAVVLANKAEKQAINAVAQYHQQKKSTLR